jgi:hypothetical protein
MADREGSGILRKPLMPLMSSARGDWETPEDHYAALNAEFHFTGDITSREGGFDWGRDCWFEKRGTSLFGNPEYGRKRKIDAFLEKAIDELEDHKGLTIVLLLPSRTGNHWFHRIILPKASEIRFIEGRLKFKGAKAGAPFDSFDVVFRS